MKGDLPRLSRELVGSRQMVENMRNKLVETLNVECPDRTYVVSTSNDAGLVTGGCGDVDGFEILDKVQNRLESMNSGKLKTALGVIDAAAKVSRCSADERWKTDDDTLFRSIHALRAPGKSFHRFIR